MLTVAGCFSPTSIIVLLESISTTLYNIVQQLISAQSSYTSAAILGTGSLGQPLACSLTEEAFFVPTIKHPLHGVCPKQQSRQRDETQQNQQRNQRPRLV